MAPCPCPRCSFPQHGRMREARGRPSQIGGAAGAAPPSSVHAMSPHKRLGRFEHLASARQSFKHDRRVTAARIGALRRQIRPICRWHRWKVLPGEISATRPVLTPNQAATSCCRSPRRVIALITAASLSLSLMPLLRARIVASFKQLDGASEAPFRTRHRQACSCPHSYRSSAHRRRTLGSAPCTCGRSRRGADQ